MDRSGEPADVARRLLEAFSAADFEGMRATLDKNLAAYITNAQGEHDRVDGREEYLSRIEAMDLPSARFSVELTQTPVPVDFDQVLVMSRCVPSAMAGPCTTLPPTCCASRMGG